MTVFLQNFLATGQEGLHLIATAVLPVLFPFFVLTSLVLNLTTTTKPWLVSVLAYCSGYPNGARLTQSLYQQQRLSLPQAQRLLITTSTPSPVFVIATAGMVFLGDVKVGCAMFFCTILSAIVNGWLWQFHSVPTPKTICLNSKVNTRNTNFFTALSDAFTSATSAIVNVCGIVLFFYIFTHLLHLPSIINGLIEMTTGVATTKHPLLVQFFISFGGLSVAMQQQIFMQNLHMKFRTYLIGKITHGILACGMLSVFLLFFN